MDTHSTSRNTLFVFGSFSEGMFHYGKIAPFIENRRPATVRGTLFRLPGGLPVLSNDGCEIVQGTIVSLSNHQTLRTLLDAFHGVNTSDPSSGLFYRVETEAQLDDGTTEFTETYVINSQRLPRGASRIEGADWERALCERPPLFERLTPRQRAYIQKLGASSGREIVPIDLTLYRELMHLEIVIDKGRRLALTSLGNELYRMLT